MSVVHDGEPLGGGMRAAIKFPVPVGGESAEEVAERFHREREALVRLDHPHVVRMIAADADAGWLALAYVDGGRLSDRLRNGPVPPDLVVPWLVQICRAADHVHAAGLVHRDIKPGNVLISGTGTDEHLTLIDFGLATSVRSRPGGTRDELVLGSPHGMAPEQIRGDRIDGRSDIYAIGCLAWRALAGRWPFHGQNPAATMAMQVRAPAPRIDSVVPGVPKELADIIERTMAKDPAARFVSASELAKALEPWVPVVAPPVPYGVPAAIGLVVTAMAGWALFS